MRKLLIIVAAVLFIVSSFCCMTEVGRDFFETIYAVVLMLADILGYIFHDQTAEYILAAADILTVA